MSTDHKTVEAALRAWFDHEKTAHPASTLGDRMRAAIEAHEAAKGERITVESINRALDIDLWQVPSFRADVRIDFREDGSVIGVKFADAPDPSESDREALVVALMRTRLPSGGFAALNETQANALIDAILAAGFRRRPTPAPVVVETVEELEAKVADVLAYYQCRETNPKADHPRMGYHAFSEDQREHLRDKKAEAAGEIVRMMRATVLTAQPAPVDASIVCEEMGHGRSSQGCPTCVAALRAAGLTVEDGA